MSKRHLLALPLLQDSGACGRIGKHTDPVAGGRADHAVGVLAENVHPLGDQSANRNDPRRFRPAKGFAQRLSDAMWLANQVQAEKEQPGGVLQFLFDAV